MVKLRWADTVDLRWSDWCPIPNAALTLPHNSAFRWAAVPPLFTSPLLLEGRVVE